MSRWENRDDKYSYIELANGLECVIRHVESEPNAVRLQLVIHAGSNAERGYEEYGLAHAFEHMVFKGTNGNDSSTNLEYELPTIKLSERDIPLIARTFGADFNAYTKVNMTSYYFQVDPAFAKPFLQILACSLDRTRLEEEHFKSEKKAILEEMYAGKDSFVRDALKSMRKAMYRPGDARYHPTIGYEEGLVNATSVHLKAFYDRNYHPKNATLFVTGNVRDREKELQTWIETMFEPIKRKGPVFEYWKHNNNIINATTTNDQRKSSVDKVVKFHTIAPSAANLVFGYRHAGGTWGKAAALLSKIWCGGKNSRLYQKLVVGRSSSSSSSSSSIGKVTEISCFTDLDYSTGETYFILSGTRQIADHIDDWREILQNGILQQLTPAEKRIGLNWMAHTQHVTRTSLSETTEEWIESHHLSRSFDTVFFVDGEQVFAEANSRINSEFMTTKPFGWAYVAFSDTEAAGVHRRMLEERAKFDALLDDDAHVRTAPLEPPHALEMFEFAYKDAIRDLVLLENDDDDDDDDDDNNTPWVIRRAGIWNCYSLLTTPAFPSTTTTTTTTTVAIFPKEHKAIALTLEGVRMHQLAELMREVHGASKFEENGVFGHSSSLLLTVVTTTTSGGDDDDDDDDDDDTNNNEAFFIEFIKKFGLAISEDDGDKIRAYYRKHKHRLSAENELMIKNVKMDPIAVGTDIVEELCSDSHYYNLEMWSRERKTFDVDKAIATYNKYWTNAVFFVKFFGDQDQDQDGDQDGDQDQDQDQDQDDSPTRYLAPRRVPHSAEAIRISESVSNVPLQNPIVFLARSGSMTRGDLRYDTVRAVAEIIMFGSLGSRLFAQMRERGGDVYSCSGFYGRNATEKHCGYDAVVLKVNLGHEEEAAAKARKFLSTFRPVTSSELRAAKTMLIYNWKKMSAERNVTGFFVNMFDGDLKKMRALLARKIQALSEVSAPDVDDFIRSSSSSPYNVTVNIK